jgi:predicted alpha/beta hydrolase
VAKIDLTSPLTLARVTAPPEPGIVNADPKWFKKLTLRRGAGLMALWLMSVVLVPLFAIVGASMGAIKGTGIGLHEGVMEAWRTLVRAYELLAKE